MDKCEQCGHRWHGLTCGWTVSGIGPMGIETQHCDCPSQFVDKSTLDLPPES